MIHLEEPVMIAKTTIAAALISLGTLAAVPAQANGISVEIGFGGPGWGGYEYGSHHRSHRLSTDEIRWMLRDSGYRHVRFLDDHGPVYQLRARRHGDTYFLVVNARTGEILSRNRI